MAYFKISFRNHCSPCYFKFRQYAWRQYGAPSSAKAGNDVYSSHWRGEQQGNHCSDLEDTTWNALLPGTATSFEAMPTTAASFDAMTITAVSGSSTISIKNVLFGEVWACSGQSNIEYRIGTTACWMQINICCFLKGAQCGYG